MKISVIVPAFNEEKQLPRSLPCIREAARAWTDRGWAFELVVCDNNSTDRTAEIARAEGAQVVFEPINQISRSRNTGASAATGDWLVFIDADSYPTRELFDDVAGAIATGRCIGGGAFVRMDHPGVWLRVGVGGWNLISRSLRWMAGSFIFCDAQAFRELGGFSLKLYISEEIEFSQRLKGLARQKKRKIIILRRHPLLTSARKLHLYGFKDYVRLISRLTLSGGTSRKRRDQCGPWYDGRR